MLFFCLFFFLSISWSAVSRSCFSPPVSLSGCCCCCCCRRKRPATTATSACGRLAPHKALFVLDSTCSSLYFLDLPFFCSLALSRARCLSRPSLCFVFSSLLFHFHGCSCAVIMFLPSWLPSTFLAICLAGQGLVAGLTLDVNDEGMCAPFV